MKEHFYKVRIHCLLFLAFSSMCSFNAIAQTSSTSEECEWRNIKKLFEAKNYEAAGELCEKCIQSNPENWLYYGGRAAAICWIDPKDETGLGASYYFKMIDKMPIDFPTKPSILSWYNGASLHIGAYWEANKNLEEAKSYYNKVLIFTPGEPTATSRLLKINEELRITAELKARQDAELEKERVAMAARAAAAKTAKAVTQSHSYEPRWVSSSQAGLPDVVYMCQYCAITVNKAYGTGSPSNGRCSRNSTAHQWLVAGSVGTNSYSCQHCDKVISLAGGSPSNIRCPALNGSVHRWNKL